MRACSFLQGASRRRCPPIWFCVVVLALNLSTHSSKLRAADATDKDPAVAQQLVVEALQAEVKGDGASRQSLLSEAAKVAPECRLAHWQQSEVLLGNQWLPAEEAQRLAAADPRLLEYAQLRASAGENLDGQLALARWCRKHQLFDEAKVHWINVLTYEPNNDEALRALGKRWDAGRLMSYAEIDAAKQRVRDSRLAAKQ
jgi:hypothetical protein